MRYSLTQAEYRKLKTRLTTYTNRLKKVYQPSQSAISLPREQKDAIIKAAGELAGVCAAAQRIFEEKGSPDDWSLWERAKEDARSVMQRLQPSW